MRMKYAATDEDESVKDAVLKSERPSLSHYFERVDDFNLLSPEDFLDRFERFGFLWFKAKGSEGNAKIPTKDQMLDFVKDHSAACEASWTIENYSKDIIRNSSGLSPNITPQNIHDCAKKNISFYVSTIVHRRPTAEDPQEIFDSDSKDD